MYMNYTLQLMPSGRAFDDASGQWHNARVPLGDIAPHKVNAELTVPITDWARVHARTNVAGAPARPRGRRRGRLRRPELGFHNSAVPVMPRRVLLTLRGEL